MRLTDAGGDVFEQVVVVLHLFVVLGFAVEPIAEVHNWLGMVGGGLLKKF